MGNSKGLIYNITGAYLALMLAFTACMRSGEPFDKEEFALGIVQWTGAPEADGCGWLIQVGDKVYHPVNLDEAFRIDQVQVWIRYSFQGEDFQCGLNPELMRSIRLSEIHLKKDEIGILGEDQWDLLTTDMFWMDSVYLDGDFLHLHVSYSGGCRIHQFDLWRLPPNPLDPPPVEVLLNHEDNGDTCEALIRQWLVFSLIPLREKGKNEVTFLLRGNPIMSSYYGTYIYRY